MTLTWFLGGLVLFGFGSPPAALGLFRSGFGRGFRAIGHIEGVGSQGPITLGEDFSGGGAEIRGAVLRGEDLLALGADELKGADFSGGREDAAMVVFPDRALEEDLFAGPVDAPLGEDVALEGAHFFADLGLPDALGLEVALGQHLDEGDVVFGAGHQQHQVGRVHRPLHRLQGLGVFEGHPAQFPAFAEEHAVGVGVPQGKDLHVLGEADDPGPGHGRAGL